MIEKIKEVNKSKIIFISSLSHEMRNPLNSMLGSMEILRNSEKLDEHMKEILERGKASGEILLGQLNNILDAGKISTNNLEIDKSPA